MPKYQLKRQGYNVIVEGYHIVVTGVCERLNHEIRFNVGGHTTSELKARNNIIEEFMGKMNGNEYTPDGPTMYCKDCQEQCRYKGMEG